MTALAALGPRRAGFTGRAGNLVAWQAVLGHPGGDDFLGHDGCQGGFRFGRGVPPKRVFDGATGPQPAAGACLTG